MRISPPFTELQERRSWRQLFFDPRVQLFGRAVVFILAGFILSAASLANAMLPLAAGLVFACTGWSAVLCAAGSIGGYLLFWGSGGIQAVLWTGAAVVAALLVQNRHTGQMPFLLPALSGLAVSASGVLFQLWLGDTTPVEIYLLRVCMGGAAPWLFRRALGGRNPIVDWLVCAFGVLALAQIAPTPGFSLGIVTGAALSVMGAFPAAALAGVALDLSGITSVSMTAVLCVGYLVRFLTRYPRWLGAMAPAGGYILVMWVTGHMDMTPLPGILLGGIAGVCLPLPAKLPHRRGETGVAQVRLEMAASVLAQTEQLLLEVAEVPVDEDALLTRAAEQACASCPLRKNCKDSRRLARLPAAVLHKPLLTPEEIPIVCRKSGRFLLELHRAQEQMRTIRADRQRQKEYRAAVIQQYGFLSEYLHGLSDCLARRTESYRACYEPLVQAFGNRPEMDNGDRCMMFSGPGCRYYVLLCDGMGTGMGAVQEGKTAAGMLRRLLTAGYPAEYALRSLNSLCALRSRAGVVTVDLLELQLETGKVTVYKWGAAPSYLLTQYGVEKIGTAGPPPGLSVDSRETVYRLSLRRGEMLLLVSDGVGEEEALHCLMGMTDRLPGEVASRLLQSGQLSGDDDATVITVRLGQKGSGI